MEMHHRLRRDPNWDPNSCNICGGLGHQAVTCPNGTIDWRAVYGDKAFILRPPLYSEQWKSLMNPPVLDVDAIAKQAEEYGKGRLQAIAENPALATQVVPPTVPYATQATVRVAPNPAVAAPAPAAAPVQEELPPGWATAKDAQGRTYYWHTTTKKVQWNKPTPADPIV